MRRGIAGVLCGVVLAGLLVEGAWAAQPERTVDPGQQEQAMSSIQNFFDVPEDAYYAAAAYWAVGRGMVSGTGERLFEPDTLCTNAQVVTMLWRGMGSPEPVGASPFSDVPAGTYYEKAAVWAYEAGLVSGTEFYGEQPCSRGAIVTMLWKLAGQPAAQSQAGGEWNLRLVNAWNAVPQDLAVELAPVEGCLYSVDARCADALNQMLADCWAAGYSPLVCSGYRTQQTQERLFSQAVEKWIARGMSRSDAERTAARSTAVPGTSEHQLGLAADIIDIHYPKLNEVQASRPTQKWLMEHCWEYGFILRYPPDKGEKTGIIYEPWHYRYVGREYAQAIRQSGLCLEEFLQK